jgi:precorrin-2 dehydrogenase/sirohydrochlorin ferrochelatase
MRYYPVYLDIKGRPCVVVGGGAVAERKVEGLIKAGAAVTVISPKITKKISRLVKKEGVEHLRRGYRAGDLGGYALVVCASSSKAINSAAYGEAAGRNIPVNVVDDPKRCFFIIPSVVDRGGLVVAISTSGKVPLLARTFRVELEKVELLGAVRNKLLKNGVNSVKKEKILGAIINSPVRGWLKSGSRKEVNGFLKGLLGDKYTLGGLGIRSKGKDAAKK